MTSVCCAPVENIVSRVRGEFIEMPGPKLTLVQAQRLWGIDRETCEAVFEELTQSRFLVRTRDGALVLGEWR
jgi:Fic family protein